MPDCVGVLSQHVLASLVQTATLYKDANKMLPKEYVLKVQSVKSDDIRGKRTTIGKCEINLADYCALGNGSSDVPVRLR